MDEFIVQTQNNYGKVAGKGKAVASMVLGIVSVVFCCCLWYIAFPCAIVGLILGIISRKNNEPGKGMAVAGIVLSIIALSLAIIVLITAGAILSSLPYSVDSWDSLMDL